MFKDKELKILADIAKNAGDITLKYYKRNPEVIFKQDGSPCTAADREAEEYVLSELSKVWKDIPAVGEESYDSFGLTTDLGLTHWLIDALDGTKEYINERDTFTVNIALVEKGLPVAGVIYAPALGLMYSASVGFGAFRGHGYSLVKLPLADTATPIAAISRSYKGNLEQRISSVVDDVRFVQIGSSLKFCLVAEGSASFYIRSGRTMHWDTAAGHAIVKAAGGRVDDWKTGEELTYLNKSMDNRSFVTLMPKWAETVATLRQNI